MDFADKRISRTGYDGERNLGLVALRQKHQAAGARMDPERLALALRARPLVEAVGGDDAPALPEGLADGGASVATQAGEIAVVQLCEGDLLSEARASLTVRTTWSEPFGGRVDFDARHRHSIRELPLESHLADESLEKLEVALLDVGPIAPLPERRSSVALTPEREGLTIHDERESSPQRLR